MILVLMIVTAAIFVVQGDPSLSEITLTLNKTNGDFEIALSSRGNGLGGAFLKGGEVRVDDLSRDEGSLSLIDTKEGHDEDEMGTYDFTTFAWGSSDAKVLMETTFRTYEKDGGLIVFEQHFPNHLGAFNETTLLSRTLFPTFYRDGPELDCFSYHGVFPSMKSCSTSTYQESHQGGSPLIVYDSSSSKEDGIPMVVFSPVDFPKAHHMASDTKVFGAGVKSSAEIVPEGWTQRFMLSAGDGIRDGMMRWGDRLLTFTGKKRVDNRYRDDVHGKIGFWTDNGGYYHYALGNVSANATYEDVLPVVKAYHDKIGVPFGHWQFDSWFYPKDGGVSPGGGGGAVTNWTAMPSVFPSGMAHIGEILNVPIVMHNRQWSPVSDYVKHLSFEWYLSEKAAVPKDPAAFFAYFFDQQSGWHLSMYEQDWMCTEYDEVSALQTNLSLADMWLKGMADGVENSKRTQQYCMPYPYDVLAASAFPAVTNARYVLRCSFHIRVAPFSYLTSPPTGPRTIIFTRPGISIGQWAVPRCFTTPSVCSPSRYVVLSTSLCFVPSSHKIRRFLSFSLPRLCRTASTAAHCRRLVAKQSVQRPFPIVKR